MGKFKFVLLVFLFGLIACNKPIEEPTTVTVTWELTAPSEGLRFLVIDRGWAKQIEANGVKETFITDELITDFSNESFYMSLDGGVQLTLKATYKLNDKTVSVSDEGTSPIIRLIDAK